MLTSDGWEVKLGLAVREDEEVMLPWLLPIPPVPDSPGGGLCELIASSLAGNGFVVTGEHSQEKTGFFSPHEIPPGWRVAEMCWSLITSTTPRGRTSTSQQIFL